MSVFTNFAHSIIDLLAAVATPALAIVLFTVLVRLLISPITYWQVRGERRRAKLAPQLAALRDKHKGDPMALATAQMELQRAHGISMFGPLLPALAQAPFFWLMYRVSSDGLIAGSLFGHPLTAHVGQAVPVFAALITLSAVLAWWSSRRMKRLNPETPAWMTWLPYLSVPFMLIMPLAAALYLVTSSAWTALEHAVLRRPPASVVPGTAPAPVAVAGLAAEVAAKQPAQVSMRSAATAVPSPGAKPAQAKAGGGRAKPSAKTRSGRRASRARRL